MSNDYSRPQGVSVGDAIAAANARWGFGGDVAEGFDSHIERSVPGYREVHDLIGASSDFFVREGSRVYELGCSTGALSAVLGARHGDRDVEIIGVDRESTMVSAARKRCADLPKVSIVEADLLEHPLEPASLIVACFTMQFVQPVVRQQLFDRIYESLEWGGALLLFEKVRAPDARFQDLMTSLYTDYKLEQGFSDAEIIAKSRSLKGVLEPFSTQGNLDLMQRAGFVDVMSIWKRLCFEGFLAIK